MEGIGGVVVGGTGQEVFKEGPAEGFAGGGAPAVEEEVGC